MPDSALSFSEANLIGRVAAVDTTRVLVHAHDSSLVTRVGVGNLVAVRGATEQEFLIALIEKVTRAMQDDFLDEDQAIEDDPDQMMPQAEDYLRCVLVGTYRTVHGSKRDVFKRGADSFPQIDRESFLIEGGNLQRFMNLLGKELEEDERLTLGYFALDQGTVAVASGDRFFQRHAAILGSTGSGKSFAVALLLERASRLRHSNIIVFDLHGEYAPLCGGEEPIGRRFRIAGPGDLQAPDNSAIFLPYWALNRDEMLSILLDRSDNNAPNQASRFTERVRELKEEFLTSINATETLATFTVDSPIPYRLEDLISRLEADNVERVAGARASSDKAGPWFDKLTRFLGRLKAKTEDRRYGFLFAVPDEALKYDWLTERMVELLTAEEGRPGIKIVDFSEVPADVLPVVVGVFARLLYSVQFWMAPEWRTPFALICDEAHLYLPVRTDVEAEEKQALDTFERIAKEGRKYGTSLVVVSQRPADVSRTILSQCNNFLVLRLTNDQDQAVVKRLVPDSMGGLVDWLPLLDTGESILLGDAVLLPTRIKLDLPRIEPSSATREFWHEWAQRQPSADAIRTAVETLRRQTRI